LVFWLNFGYYMAIIISISPKIVLFWQGGVCPNFDSEFCSVGVFDRGRRAHLFVLWGALLVVGSSSWSETTLAGTWGSIISWSFVLATCHQVKNITISLWVYRTSCDLLRNWYKVFLCISLWSYKHHAVVHLHI